MNDTGLTPGSTPGRAPETTPGLAPETTPGLAAGRLLRLRWARLTYPEVGATGLSPDGPDAGYHQLRRRAAVGAGPTQFHWAAESLMTWQVQRRAGFDVRASSERVVEGAVADLHLAGGPFRVTAPVRVVEVVDEPLRRGFAYGTLPGHPVAGEERFVVQLEPTGVVLFTVTAFSRPASTLARLGGPFGRLAQDAMAHRYLAALRAPEPLSDADG